MTDSAKPLPGAVVPTPQQTAAVGTVRARVQPQLEALLTGMFDRLPALLQEWSQGKGEAEQKPYLDLVQTLRRHRGDLEAAFRRGLAKGFDALQPQPGAGARNIDFTTLSLVATEDMDLAVTADSMVARARLQLAAPLSLLKRRYAHVLPRVEVTESTMPLDPHCVVSAFKEGIAPLDADTAQKTLLLRAFHKLVLEALEPLLDEANRLFVEARVLPELKVAAAADTAKKAKPAALKPVDKAAPTGAPAASGNTEEIFSFLKGVLGQAGAGVPGGPVAGGHYHGGQYVGGGRDWRAPGRRHRWQRGRGAAGAAEHLADGRRAGGGDPQPGRQAVLPAAGAAQGVPGGERRLALGRAGARQHPRQSALR